MRLGQEGLILKQRIAVAGPTRADARPDWELRARPDESAGPVEVGVAEDPRHLPEAV